MGIGGNIWAEEDMVNKVIKGKESKEILIPEKEKVDMEKEKSKGRRTNIQVNQMATQESNTVPSIEELERVQKDREKMLKEIGYTPPKPFDVPVSEEEVAEVKRMRREMLKKMGIDPDAPKKSIPPPDYKPREPSKEELEKARQMHLEKTMEYQRELFEEAMKYKEKGQLEEALATFEKLMDAGSSPVVEKAVKEMVKIQGELGLLEQVEESPKNVTPGFRKLLDEELPEFEKKIREGEIKVKPKEKVK